MNKKCLVTMLVIFMLMPLAGAETKLIGNYISLTVSNDTGGFVLYGRNNVNDQWAPLLFEDIPPTSYFRFYSKNSMIPFGEEGKGRSSETKIEDDKIIYYWKDESIKVTLTYQLESSNAARSADTLIIDAVAENLTKDIEKIDFYLCIDTHLGEQSKEHFVLPGNYVIQNETEINETAMPSSIFTYSPQNKIGLTVHLNKEGQVPPERVFFANWRRVKENIGSFKVKEGRDFDLKPYSMNDSSLNLEYTAQEIVPNREKKYRFVLSMKNDIEVKKDTSGEVGKITGEETAFEEKKDELEIINLNLSDLIALLDKINKKLESGEKLTDEDAALSKKILEEIKKRRNK